MHTKSQRGHLYRRFAFFLCFSNLLFFTSTLFSQDDEGSNDDLSRYDFNPEYCCKNLSDLTSTSEPVPLANLEGEPSAYVHGCVNVITGMYCEFDTDLILHHGTDPIRHERSFAGGMGIGTTGGGWYGNHQSSLTYKKAKKKSEFGQNCLYADDHGGKSLDFVDKGGYNYQLALDALEKGVANTSQNFISGQSNLRNLKFVADNKNPKIITGSNLSREFTRLKHDKKNIYKLSKEIKPNGNQFSYSYTRYGLDYALKKIELLNQKKQLQGYIEFLPRSLEHRDKLCFKAITNDGRWVCYEMGQSKEKRYRLDKVKRSDGLEVDYQYNSFYYNGNLIYETIWKKILPDERFLQLDYYWHGHNYVMQEDVNLKDGQDPRIYRVKNLFAPAGTDTTLIPIYQFIYDLFITTDSYNNKLVKHGSCSVYNALGYRTQYGFNEDHRLTAINKFNANGEFNTQERLFWGDNKSKDNTCLITRDLVYNSASLFARNYQYDHAGNVLVDSLYGNLTGHNHASPTVLANGTVIENGCDCYSKYQDYTNDGLNLLLREFDGFLSSEYTYEPGTNRLAAKYQGTTSKWLRRTFYFYNDDAALVKEISDDGYEKDFNDLSGVTERKIFYYTQSTSYPAAYPLIIEEKCLDLATGQEQHVHKVVNTYTNEAKISKQDHYDSKGDYAYSLLWDYDKMGNITREVNALGQATTRRFDASGNCIFEELAGKTNHKLFTYDFMNRLIKEQDIHTDRQYHTINHQFDVASNEIATIDENGNETLFKYDAFGRVIEIIYPPVLNEEGKLCRPTIKKEYNPLSKVTREVNAQGTETLMSYTIRGQLAEIIYPDGTTEKNTYYLNGSLKESKAKNNSVTKYNYDCFGRPIQTDIVTENGELLSTVSMSYNGLHLISETDPKGIVTSYTYYPDGKIKSKMKGDYSIIFSYDSLGRQNKTTERYGPNNEDLIVKTKDYDLLNRVTAETVFDANNIMISKIDYTYDAAGNVCQIVNYTQMGCNITKNDYNSHGVLELSIDAEGNKTVTECQYDYHNALGQIVDYQEITDPQGNISITISDVFGRIASKITKNAYGKITQKKEHSYDLKGNLCVIIDTVISKQDTDQDIISIMQYDACDRLVTCYEAYGTAKQKQTKIIYNKFGQKESLIKNDGVILSHTYDPLGRLHSHQSSDGNINYSYEYDLNSNPIRVKDHINGTATVRKYDQNDFMVCEELSNGLTLRYRYDYTGRTSEITLPDDTKIAYEYKATQLKTVRRLNSSDQVDYIHQYQSYDYSGNLTKSILINDTGTLNYNYDMMGRLKSTTIDSDRWKEQIKSYDSVGNILEISLCDGLGEVSLAYNYDDLYQIVSETGSTDHSYSYDSHYNRRTKNGRIYSVNPLHELIDDGISVFSYDRNGNMEKIQSKEHTSEFVYDALDRLIFFVKDAQKVAYRYDENNRRLSKTFYSLEENNYWHEQETVRYLYQGENEIGSVDEEGRINELRVLGLGKGAEIGAAIALELNQKIFAPIHDHIGNIACLLDSATGALTETYRYSSFGEELFDGQKAISPWRFSSKRSDLESGLVYFGRRYYAPEIGRWATPDPIGREGGPNLYAYVLNSPLTHFDLYGLYAITDRLESAFGNICNRFAKLFSFLAQIPGHIVGFIGREILPIPYVNHLVAFGGWCLRGQNPAAYDWSQHRSQILVHPGSNHANPNHIFASANGICTSKDDHLKRLGEISESYGGVTVYGLHSAHNGFILDNLEAGCQKLGIPTNGQLVANRELKKILNQQEGNRAQTTIYMDAHSRGAETIYHLDDSLRKKMEVTAFAPARIASDGHFKKADYYISPLDGVPLLSPIGYYKGVKNRNVHFLPTTGNPISDHMYDNKYFKQKREQNGLLYQQTHGKAA